MHANEFMISRILFSSLIYSISTPLLIVLASLLDPKENSFSQAFLGYLAFYALVCVLGAVIMTAVSVASFALATNRWGSKVGGLVSFFVVFLLGIVIALSIGQFREADVLSIVIVGMAIGSLAGPLGAIGRK